MSSRGQGDELRDPEREPCRDLEPWRRWRGVPSADRTDDKALGFRAAGFVEELVSVGEVTTMASGAVIVSASLGEILSCVLVVERLVVGES